MARAGPMGFVAPPATATRSAPQVQPSDPAVPLLRRKANFTVKAGHHHARLQALPEQVGLGSTFTRPTWQGVSSMKLVPTTWTSPRRPLGTWPTGYGETWNDESRREWRGLEIAQTYIGGKERNKSRVPTSPCWTPAGWQGRCRRDEGPRDRAGHQRVVEHTDAPTLQGFVHKHTEPRCEGLHRRGTWHTMGCAVPHEAVITRLREYVRGMAHANGMESHWAMLNRDMMGSTDHFSKKHLGRYVDEFSGRHNSRPR